MYVCKSRNKIFLLFQKALTLKIIDFNLTFDYNNKSNI